MKKIAFVVLSSAMVLAATAQSLSDGIKAVYYQKYKTAKEIFQKQIAANSADPEANYWLGQVLINENDLPAARNAYAKAMTTTNQNPLIVVGMGHVELLEGKAADAKAHFEAALAATSNKKGGDPVVLTAVGRANADGDSKTGDPAYGLEKLAIAAKLDTKSPEILILTGITQLKRGGEYGGEAKKAYEEALTRDPKYAQAKLRIAKIFQSQNNKELFLPLMEEATQLDPNYGPGWLALYSYYAQRDVNKAKEYLDHYMAVADKDCETDFFYADYLLQAGKRDEALAKAKEIENACNGDAFPKVYKLYAIIYNRTGDSLQARDYMSKYIAKEKALSIGAEDYANYALILLKFPGSEAEAERNVELAISKDTAAAKRLEYANQMAAAFGKAGNFCGQNKWMMLYISSKTTPLTATDYYYWGDAVTKCANATTTDSVLRTQGFTKADSIYGEYIAKYPDQIQGYAFRAAAAKLADADTSKGIALPAINAYTEFLMKDTVKNKSKIINNYYYLIPYFAKIKDFQRVLDATNVILMLDPANAYALNVKKIAEGQLKSRGSNTLKNPSTTDKNGNTSTAGAASPS